MNGTLHEQLLDAHARSDKCALVSLYVAAAEQSPSEDERGFFLTQAYIFALETGAPMQHDLRKRLVVMGRETPPQPEESCR